MQKRIYSILFCLLIMNNSFSQSIKETITAQLDKIVSLPMGDKEFRGCAFLNDQVYVLQRAKDSLLVTGYTTTRNGEIENAGSIWVGDDSLFLATVDVLYNDVKQKHNYQPYSSEELAIDSFSLTLVDKNKLQVVSRKEASPSQMKNMEYILNRLHAYSFIPYKKHSKRLHPLNVTGVNELLKYLKSN
jgi:hypothetical protein